MPLSQNEIPILTLKCQVGRLYYYQGNFYHPLDLSGRNVGLVKGAIRDFIKENKALVDSDRSCPEYKTLIEIFDECHGYAT